MRDASEGDNCTRQSRNGVIGRLYSSKSLSAHTMSSHVPGSDIFHKNPYESHPSLSPTEAEVLWEYAKLAQHVKEVQHSPTLRRTIDDTNHPRRHG
jgi:hypothetical protein